ncbi:Amine oxidase OS=Tsukamurella paurometabola (strain ATCC 8368 / DSM / CCUG 35730 / CIP 100753/ JCM 10117 / KCTC 9821 / NBRC 16120 / NCIMB 702349 / NCTC 13040) OX=521096 GN=Tpau_2837 PE=4 SV=1 [Tsukamurella paurometabola]|uniref:Amine oxidase n=1 Tax=Tsukamurella paurometabola (strain ATCC 8368 / DSM 20162 / CCUG 35730 / CIP 100753 / JCM 10117 / KCTC 9821 / NBRC 16120 / NCIMB 702349 / NCTC 13040) TaxID=521096 RepID=D5UTF0_TSUPD|nr:NAD(P)/FAD-dependent oxidoreductase [Tsukamurella paurometabola]ADG79435.1 amine oxidase [Tsukamurella paurometabola DSM 20162]SUP35722.1 Putrescine oxidase [Tsukamurella paurometabola]
MTEQVREESREVVVIGAGMSGLMAGNTLADRDVIVLEASDRPGGRVESVRRGDYWINVGTQFTEGTGTLIEELDKHGIERGTLAGKKVALVLNGRLVDTANPVALLFRTKMTMRDRLGMALVGARIVSGAIALEAKPDGAIGSRVRAALDDRPASYILRGVRSKVADAVVRAFSGQWMGCEPEETAATQFVTSIGIALADPAKVPNFSLPVGGNQTLTDILAEDLGDRLRLGATVDSVSRDGDGVRVEYHDAGGPARIRAKRAVVTVPADIAVRILPELPRAYRDAYTDIAYGRYVVVGFFTDEQGPQRWDDFFAVSTPLLSFQAMFNHAAAVRGPGARKPGGALACFAGGAKADELFRLTDEEIAERFTRDLLGVYPELAGKLGEPIVRRHHRVVPFWGPGERASLPILREPLGPIHLAGDFQLDMPSLADAATSGERAARAVLASL